ncbi:TetR/AcrR family transcriptional regulator [Isoalcanivorax indicus]|uniref:TetR/AcrR family transcriptional regulator n=1 Tax=Isoalcanivorax indicus TaxID=2202653 RepID=UPI0013C4C49E|nr:TetR/AcrR family transcriptional regulator [Isoalcanivorax indicus]
MTDTPSTSRSTANRPAHGRAYRGVSIEQRRAERREKLIQAGINVFGSTGFQGTTVRALCAEAGLTERYFYESFSNSEALLCNIYVRLTDQIRDKVSGAISRQQGEPDAMADAALTAYFEFLHDNPGAARIIMTEIIGVSPEVDALYRKVMNDFAAFLLVVFRGLHPERSPHAVQDTLIATGMIGALVNMAMRWLLNDFKESVTDMVAAAHFILIAVNNQLLRTKPSLIRDRSPS